MNISIPSIQLTTSDDDSVEVEDSKEPGVVKNSTNDVPNLVFMNINESFENHLANQTTTKGRNSRASMSMSMSLIKGCTSRDLDEQIQDRQEFFKNISNNKMIVVPNEN
jgi:hypothetical protein